MEGKFDYTITRTPQGVIVDRKTPLTLGRIELIEKVDKMWDEGKFSEIYSTRTSYGSLIWRQR
jgi:hypothetical protein